MILSFVMHSYIIGVHSFVCSVVPRRPLPEAFPSQGEGNIHREYLMYEFLNVQRYNLLW